MARSMARITPGHVRDLAERTDPDAVIIDDTDGAFSVRALFRAPSGGDRYVRIRYTSLTTTVWPVDDRDAAPSDGEHITLGRKTRAAVLDAIVGAL